MTSFRKIITRNSELRWKSIDDSRYKDRKIDLLNKKAFGKRKEKNVLKKLIDKPCENDTRIAAQEDVSSKNIGNYSLIFLSIMKHHHESLFKPLKELKLFKK